MPILMIILAIVAVLILVGVGAYNKYIRLKNLNEEGWSGIEVYLQKRLDLIPNLVNTVKGYAAHEKGVFEEVTKARSAIMDAKGVKETAEAENQLEGALKSLFAVAESYPDLKANQNFSELQAELVDTEDKIQASRRFYNGGVRDLNTKIKLFPNNIFANMLGFKEREFFEVEDRESIEKPVDVQF